MSDKAYTNEIDKALHERFRLQKECGGNNKPINQITPLVSVTVVTYRHRNYIRQCLDGILMQQTSFPYEIIIGEDGSDDDTTEICREYADSYPDKIRLFIRDRSLSQFHDSNGKRILFNGIWTRMSCRAKYVAWCEGDDYWTDPHKLQKQVDFLESHPDYTLCFHNAIVHHENGGEPDHLFAKLETRTYHWRENVDGWIVPTASMLYRRAIFESEYYKKYTCSRKMMVGDNPLVRTCGMLGKLYCFSEPMSVYRLQPTGWTQRLNPMMTYKLIEQEIEYKRIFGKEHYEPANRQIAVHSRAAVSLIAKGHIKESFRIWGLALRHAPWLVTKANIKFAYNLLRHKTME